ncbi:Uncharacterised protein [Agrobacterium tumefaciens]|nr:Uncharacterised protein [Agrobacterium tumefaciens]
MAVSTIAHMLEKGLRAQESALQVDGHHPVPIRFLDVWNGIVDRDTGIIHKNINGSKTLECRLRQRINLGLVLNVSPKCKRLGTYRSNLFSDRFDFV